MGNDMQDFKGRVKALRLYRKLTQTGLAKLIGVTPQAIQKLEAGNVKETRLTMSLGKALNASIKWLETGPEMDLNVVPPYSPPKAQPEEIPVIAWTDIPAWFTGKKKALLDSVTEYQPRFHNVSLNSYALRLNNDAMTSPRSNVKSFYKGEIIIVDPEIEAKENSYVIATIGDSKEAVFRQVVRDGGIDYLKPLNSQYPTLERGKDVTIYGVVVFYLGALIN